MSLLYGDIIREEEVGEEDKFVLFRLRHDDTLNTDTFLLES